MLSPPVSRYRPVTYEDLPELKRAMRRVQDPFRASELLPHLPVTMRDYEPRELGRALLARGLAERAGEHRLRRCNAEKYQRAGPDAGAVPRLRERPHHPTEQRPALLCDVLGGVDGHQGGAQAQEAAGQRDEILEVEKMTTDTAMPSESQARKCEDCGGYRSERCELCRDMSEYYMREKTGRKAKGEED